jgi:hypothetical protein
MKREIDPIQWQAYMRQCAERCRRQIAVARARAAERATYGEFRRPDWLPRKR